MSAINNHIARIFHCNAPLEVIHSHLVRAQHAGDSGASFLTYPEWVSPLAVRHDMWTRAIPTMDTRPEYGGVYRRIRGNLAKLESLIPFASFGRVELVVSDLFWLMNNVVVAELARRCRLRRLEFGLSILDEGSVLYTGTQLGIRRTLRCWAKYAYLRLHGFPSLLLHPGNIDFLHPLCERVFCLHPELLDPPPRVRVEKIDASRVAHVYGNHLSVISLPSRSCLYLSQPLYKLVGIDRQLSVVQAMKQDLLEQGMLHFFYKPHHADLPSWLDCLERESGWMPLEMREMVPVELFAARCNADTIVSHSTSALLNLHAYGFRGRVIAYGLRQLRRSFPEEAQFTSYYRALKRLGTIEVVD